MAYFLGRDVDVFVTTESATNDNGSAALQCLKVTSDNVRTSTSFVSGGCIPPLAAATVVSGAVNDVTGVDLSIGISDEDIGPFLGHPQIMQKVELRKETVITVTRKKSNNFWDVMYNGPSESSEFEGKAADALRMGARFGVEYGGDTTAKISDGSIWMYDALEKSSTTTICYGYRVHLRLKATSSGEVYCLKNAVLTGHTVTLNADGVTEETLEFTSSVAAGTVAGNTFDVALTSVAEL